MSNPLGFAEKFEEFLLSFDLLAIQPNLNVFKKQKYSTFLGVFLTLCVGVITIAYLALELQELASKSLPNIVQSEKQVIETSQFTLMQDNFTLAVSVTDSNLNPLKKINQYYTISIKNCFRTRTLNATTSQVDVTNVCTMYPTDACTMDDFVTDAMVVHVDKLKFCSTSFQLLQVLANHHLFLKEAENVSSDSKEQHFRLPNQHQYNNHLGLSIH